MKDESLSSPSVLWSSLEAAVITGGRNTQDWKVTGAAINAQEVKPGDLFFATERDDLDEVFRRGAAAAVVPMNVPDKGWPLLKVADPFEALLGLAKAARFRTHAYVVSAQGPEARKIIGQILGAAFEVHSGHRHISLGLASMPENRDFGVFGFSPQARPDIAIITDCSNVNDAVFASMPPSGRVLIHAAGPEAMDVAVKARGAGIRNIFTFGSSQDADAALLDTLHASNGARARLRILGETVETVLPAGQEISPAMLAGALLLKLFEVSAARAGMILAGLGAVVPLEMPEANIQLLAAGDDVRYPAQAAFRVANMIDLGQGRRTVVLDNVPPRPDGPPPLVNKDLAIPRKIDNLNVVYACKGLFLFPNAEAAIRDSRPASRLESIGTEVLAPGDYVAFKGLLGESKKLISSALRVIGPPGKKTKADYAL